MLGTVLGQLLSTGDYLHLVADILLYLDLASLRNLEMTCSTLHSLVKNLVRRTRRGR